MSLFKISLFSFVSRITMFRSQIYGENFVLAATCVFCELCPKRKIKTFHSKCLAVIVDECKAGTI